MRVSDLGEFPLIDRVAEIVAVNRPDVIVGIGDDVAVLEGGGDEWLLAKVDSQVEGVHFTVDAISPRQLGRRALAVQDADLLGARVRLRGVGERPLQRPREALREGAARHGRWRRPAADEPTFGRLRRDG